ncbi:penicillin-binding protein 2 [Patescibacteria group bacterium]|nr:penicillin-binding protein 2 [Patescibacteria group bacterium]
MGVRFITLTSIFGIAFAVLGFNLFHLQVQKGPYYLARADARDQALAQATLTRGEISITDQSGDQIVAAMDKAYPVIYAVPQEITDPSSTAAVLAPVIGWQPAALAQAISNPKSLFRMLVEKASSSTLAGVEDLNLKGVYTDEKNYRYYPFGDFASHVIGFVGLTSSTTQPVGLYGLEKYYQQDLAAGDNVQTTIDRTLQAQSEAMLENLVTTHQAQSGTVLIEDPKTGAVLAFASYPSFDPNSYASTSVALFTNQGTQYFYEPGSVFKPLTMAIGINDGILTSSTMYTDPGHVILNGQRIDNYNHRAYGPGTSMTEVLMHSINTGAVWAEQQIGDKLFKQGVFDFGFGAPTGIDLPGESPGRVVNITRPDAQTIDFAETAFGQGIGVTPIQMANAYSAIANGGLLMRPYLNAALGPKVVRRVISTSTAVDVRQMMMAAAEGGGVATVPSFHVAGKTGTAQIPDLVHGGYTQNYIDTFAGMIPATDPKLVILVEMNDAQIDGDLAALSVVPAWRKLAEFAVNYYNLQPDNPQNAITEPPHVGNWQLDGP